MKFSWCASYYHEFLHLLSPSSHVCAGVTTVRTETWASNSSLLKKYWPVNMVLDDTLGRRIYSFICNILKSATKKELKQKIDFSFFGVRHIGLIVTAVTINGFTPVSLEMQCITIIQKLSSFHVSDKLKLHNLKKEDLSDKCLVPTIKWYGCNVYTMEAFFSTLQVLYIFYI